MSNLRNKLIRLAYENPELRYDLLPLVDSRVARATLQNADGGTYDITPPPSMYDGMRNPPFQWSNPAKSGGYSGTYPLPWRVAEKDNATTWVEFLARRQAPMAATLQPYVDYWQEWRGYQALWVGLRNNRDPARHRAALQELLDAMRSSFRVRMEDGWIMLIDDIKKNALTR